MDNLEPVAMRGGLCFILLALFMSGCVDRQPANATISEQPVCKSDSDCVPKNCCHPTECVSIGHGPDCRGIMCTQECRPGTMDCCQECGCYCAGGHCKAGLNTA